MKKSFAPKPGVYRRRSYSNPDYSYSEGILKSRGWRKEEIQKYLPPPVIYKEKDGTKRKIYSSSAVNAALSAHPDLSRRVWQQHFTEEECISFLKKITKEINVYLVKRQTIENSILKNWQSKSNYQGKEAQKHFSSQRIFVNHIRHCFTNYDELRDRDYNKTQKRLLKLATLYYISKQYSYLRAECRLQQQRVVAELGPVPEDIFQYLLISE